MLRILLVTASLSTALPVGAEVPDVVTDIPPVHSLVAQVMGDLGSPSLILDQGGSAHGVALRPSQARSVSQADLIVWIGPALSPALASSLDTLAPGATRLTLLESADTTRLPIRDLDNLTSAHGDAHMEPDHDDHDHGEPHAHHDDHEHADHGHAEAHDHDEVHDHDHAHGETDPHAWLDPNNGARWLSAIADALAAQDPDNAATYRANALAGQNIIAAAETEARRLLEPVSDQPLAVYHDAFHYIEDAYGLTVIGAISASDATLPGTAHLDRLRDALAQTAPACFLTEPGANPGLIAAVAETAPVAEIDPLGTHLETGATLYPEMLVDMATRLADCVAGKGQ